MSFYPGGAYSTSPSRMAGGFTGSTQISTSKRGGAADPSTYQPQQQGGYDPAGGTQYKPVLSGGMPTTKAGGDYSAYSPRPAGGGYTGQQIYQATKQFKAAGGKGDWRSYLPTGMGGVDFSNDDPFSRGGWTPFAGNQQPQQGGPLLPGGGWMPGSPGGLRAYSDYNPTAGAGQGGYTSQMPVQSYSQGGMQPFDYAGTPPGMQQQQQYPRPGLWAFSQQPQQPQFASPSAMPQSSFSAQYGQVGGGYGGTPDTNQRDALIQRLNDTMAGYQANSGVYQGQGSPPPSWGQAPQFDIPSLWADAGKMVQGGWQNPLLGLM